MQNSVHFEAFVSMAMLISARFGHIDLCARR